MTNIVFLLLFCTMSSSVKHSLKFFLTTFSGIPNLPEFMAVTVVDDIQVGYCDSNKKNESKLDTGKRFLELFTGYCSEELPIFFKAMQHSFMQHFNQRGGVHILQMMCGCELDEKTEELTSYSKYGYDGEDIISLDLKNLTWIALKPQSVIIKQEWDDDKDRIIENENFLNQNCPEWLKKYLNYGNTFLVRTDLPSVFLLQKTPSSPVSCHATGFYPDRAKMFWRKDGELHEDVNHRQILPNHDGTFQMSVDLNISSVKPEDWGRYDCVFQLSGVKNNIVTKLEKAMMRTSWVPPSEFPAGSVIGVVVGLLLLAVCITGLFIWRKKKKNGFRPANTSDPSSLSNTISAPE